MAAVDWQATFTDTSTRISSIWRQLCACRLWLSWTDKPLLQTDTSTKGGSYVAAGFGCCTWTDKPLLQILPLEKVACRYSSVGCCHVDWQTTFADTSTRIGSIWRQLCACRLWLSWTDKPLLHTDGSVHVISTKVCRWPLRIWRKSVYMEYLWSHEVIQNFSFIRHSRLEYLKLPIFF